LCWVVEGFKHLGVLGFLFPRRKWYNYKVIPVISPRCQKKNSSQKLPWGGKQFVKETFVVRPHGIVCSLELLREGK
jgi:hypothetical protein